MKRIDILVCLELFNIRKQKSYTKQIIKDSYNVVRALCSRKYSALIGYRSVDNFETFIDEFRKVYLEKSPIEYRYCQEFIDYLRSFECFVVDSY